MRQNPRTIRVPQDVLDEAVKRVEDGLAKLLRTKKRETRQVLVYKPHPVDASGKRILIEIFVSVSARRAKSGGGLHGFAHRFRDPKGKLRAEVEIVAQPDMHMGDGAGYVVHHELLHVLDPSMDKGTREHKFGSRDYYQDPLELRAYTRNIVNEVLEQLGPGTQKLYEATPKHDPEEVGSLLETLLSSSETYAFLAPNWNEKEQEYIRKVVFRELIDAGYDPTLRVSWMPA